MTRNWWPVTGPAIQTLQLHGYISRSYDNIKTNLATKKPNKKVGSEEQVS